MKNRRLEKIKKAIFVKPYIFYFLFSFFLFIGLNIFINKIYITGSILFNNLKLGIPFIALNVLVAFLIGVNISLMVMKFKELKMLKKKEGGLTFLAIFGAFLGGACPGCFVGLFPAFLGLFGISASLSILPLYGLELQMASAVILMISTYLLTNDVVCKVE